MNPTYKIFLIKLGIIFLLSPLIGFAAFQVAENLKKASKIKGLKKWAALSIAGFLIAVLLGWLQ